MNRMIGGKGGQQRDGGLGIGTAMRMPAVEGRTPGRGGRMKKEQKC